MIERKKYRITPLSASGKEKYISGAADFGTAARSWLSVGYESLDSAARGSEAAPKIAAPEIYFSLLEAQRGIIPIFFRYINCK